MFSLPKNMLIILISAVGLHAPAAFEFETLNIENFDFIEQSQNEIGYLTNYLTTLVFLQFLKK